MRIVARLASLVALVAALAYLYDPPWIAGVTSGLRDWESESDGSRYRWTNGHASLFVPRDATWMTVPMRAPSATAAAGPVPVDISVDDRWVARVKVTDSSRWARISLPLPHTRTRRRYRRVDFRVARVDPASNHGIQLGELELTRAPQ
jgi:hypothetical protein